MRGEDVLADALLAEIDCFVIDCGLPAMSGVDLLKALRASGITVAVVLIASMADPAVRATAGATGAIVLEKPLIGGELFELIDGLLTGGPPYARSS
jgi:FixJ family two-component response regulator